jgi:hypothetical protein
MTNHDKLAEIRAAHVKAAPNDFCDMDGQWWPCDTSIVLEELDRTTAAALDFAEYQYGAAAKREFATILRGKR